MSKYWKIEKGSGPGFKPGFRPQYSTYDKGGRVGLLAGGPAGIFKQVLEKLGGDKKGKPHSTKKGRIASGIRKLVRAVKKK